MGGLLDLAGKPEAKPNDLSLEFLEVVPFPTAKARAFGTDHTSSARGRFLVAKAARGLTSTFLNAEYLNFCSSDCFLFLACTNALCETPRSDCRFLTR